MFAASMSSLTQSAIADKNGMIEFSEFKSFLATLSQSSVRRRAFTCLLMLIWTFLLLTGPGGSLLCGHFAQYACVS